MRCIIKIKYIIQQLYMLLKISTQAHTCSVANPPKLKICCFAFALYAYLLSLHKREKEVRAISLITIARISTVTSCIFRELFCAMQNQNRDKKQMLFSLSCPKLSPFFVSLSKFLWATQPTITNTHGSPISSFTPKSTLSKI